LAPHQEPAAFQEILKKAQACQVSFLDSEKQAAIKVLDQSWSKTQLQIKTAAIDSVMQL
jgi:dihydrofolate synthase/folylpolyglutamate synthase